MNDENLLNVVTAGDTTVKSSRGHLHRITLNKPAGAALAVYDNSAASGTLIATIAASTAAGTLHYGGRFMNGLHIHNGDAVRATGTLTSDATNVADGDTVTIGTTVYRFKSTMLAAYDVQIGVSAAVSLDNLKAAINASGTPGTEYFAGTLAHPTVTATTNTDTTQVVQAIAYGTSGNSIASTETSAHLSWGAGTLASGSEGTAFDLTVSYS